jgi:hypothetical protein
MPNEGAEGDRHARKAKTASALLRRRPFYRLLDRKLEKVKLRYVPEECTLENIFHFMPPPDDVPEIWPTLYDRAVSLVAHDDTLNWQKFNNMVVLNAGLLTALGFSVQHERWLFYILCFAGMAFAILFDFTLQEGMRCLRSHKAKVDALDRKLVNDHSVLFLDNPWNHREALEIGPFAMFVMWLCMLVVGLCGFVGPTIVSWSIDATEIVWGKFGWWGIAGLTLVIAALIWWVVVPIAINAIAFVRNCKNELKALAADARENR